jgi:hypothetical protein
MSWSLAGFTLVDDPRRREEKLMAKDLLRQIGPVLSAARTLLDANQRLVRVSFGTTLLLYGTSFTHLSLAYQSFEMSAWDELTDSAGKLADMLEDAIENLETSSEPTPSARAGTGGFHHAFLANLLALCRQLLAAVDPKEVERCMTSLKNCLMVLIAANVSLPVRRFALGVTFGDIVSGHVESVALRLYSSQEQVSAMVEEKFPKENFRVNREMRDEILVYDMFLTKFWAKMASKYRENSVKIWILGFRC